MMNRRLVVTLTALLAVSLFAGAAVVYDRSTNTASEIAAAQPDTLVRPHSPIIGPPGAPVTIVEFFDPSCEACRAYYPIVKQVLAEYPEEVRLVIRYAPFHDGSDEAVRILEAARMQDRYEPALEALLAAQPEWALHGQPDLNRAWQAAGAAGIDLERARRDAMADEIDAILVQDVADVEAAEVRQTPTFFVNGKPLTSFGPEQLLDLVESEVQSTRSQTGS